MIQLRFVASHSLLSKAIRLVTWSKWSHVDLVLPEGYLGARGDGVKIRPFDYYNASLIAFGTIDCGDETTQKVIDFCKAQLGKSYDYFAIFGDLFHQDWTERNTFDCSMLITAAFQYADDPLVDDTLNRVSPQMLAENPRVKLILEPIPKEK